MGGGGVSLTRPKPTLFSLIDYLLSFSPKLYLDLIFRLAALSTRSFPRPAY
jgi:hypothetical protein